MASQPEVDEFRLQLQELLERPPLAGIRRGEELSLRELTLDNISELMRNQAGRYLLMAAANLNRTSLRAGSDEPLARVLPVSKRSAYVVQQKLPFRTHVRSSLDQAVLLRTADLKRREQGTIEGLLRERIADEGIPLRMSPPLLTVPGLLVPQRRPDGIWPDPVEGLAPRLYLEIKNVRRVRDDIQKRLYEIAEVSLEMKALYGKLRLVGLNIQRTGEVLSSAARLQARLRRQITAVPPVVVGFLSCPREQAERYRAGAETFIDRIFFQEELDECLGFLRDTILRFQDG